VGTLPTAAQEDLLPTTIEAAGSELEEQLLTELIGLISEARQARSGSLPDRGFSAHDAALLSVLSPTL
jgi:hypothetical protein